MGPIFSMYFLICKSGMLNIYAGSTHIHSGQGMGLAMPDAIHAAWGPPANQGPLIENHGPNAAPNELLWKNHIVMI